jgi:hypothetical protein
VSSKLTPAVSVAKSDVTDVIYGNSQKLALVLTNMEIRNLDIIFYSGGYV